MRSRPEIDGLLPHGPSMILLDAVESWTATDIVCVTNSHRRSGNPLRRAGVLPAFAVIEYAAQAMAIHGALTGNGEARAGVLGSVRHLRMHVASLDDVPDALRVCASLRRGEARCAVYSFSIRTDSAEIASGQAAVFYAEVAGE